MERQDDFESVSGSGDEEREQELERDDVPYYNGNDERAIVECDTTAGPFAIELRRAWSPNGYDRAVELFERGFYDYSHFFRVVPSFLVQFGISYTKEEELQEFARQTIPDDPPLDPRMPFEEGMISFAGSGENSRTSHLFVAYGPNSGLGTQLWETPVGIVIQGMENLRKLNHEYGDMPPWGHGPQQHKINNLGRDYIEKDFPHVDSFKTCQIVNPETKEEGEEEEEEEEEFDDGGEKDELLKVDKEALQDTVKEKLLRKSAKLSAIKAGTASGFEVPLFAISFLLIVVIIGMRRRNKTKVSKSL